MNVAERTSMVPLRFFISTEKESDKMLANAAQRPGVAVGALVGATAAVARAVARGVALADLWARASGRLASCWRGRAPYHSQYRPGAAGSVRRAPNGVLARPAAPPGRPRRLRTAPPSRAQRAHRPPASRFGRRCSHAPALAHCADRRCRRADA